MDVPLALALPSNVEIYKLSKGPSTIYYIPNFITDAEEQYLLKAVYAVPKPKWTQLCNRRLQNWGGLPHVKGMIVEEIPKWLTSFMDKINSLGQFDGKPPNHVLINEYLPGQGIMPHLDGSLFFPTITTINLGSHTVLNLYDPIDFDNDQESLPTKNWNDRLAFSILLQPRSLLILKDAAYDHFLHGIQEIHEDHLSPSILNLESCTDVVGTETLQRTTRVSLTIRHVPKTKGCIKLHL